MKFLSPEVALYLYKSTIQPCTEYCCYLGLLDKLQKQICRTAGPSLAASFKPLVHPLLKEGLFIDLIACMIFLLLFLHMLQGCLCLQFLSSHSQTLELFLTYDLRSPCYSQSQFFFKKFSSDFHKVSMKQLLFIKFSFISYLFSFP